MDYRNNPSYSKETKIWSLTFFTQEKKFRPKKRKIRHTRNIFYRQVKCLTHEKNFYPREKKFDQRDKSLDAREKKNWSTRARTHENTQPTQLTHSMRFSRPVIINLNGWRSLNNPYIGRGLYLKISSLCPCSFGNNVLIFFSNS